MIARNLLIIGVVIHKIFSQKTASFNNQSGQLQQPLLNSRKVSESSQKSISVEFSLKIDCKLYSPMSLETTSSYETDGYDSCISQSPTNSSEYSNSFEIKVHAKSSGNYVLKSCLRDSPAKRKTEKVDAG